MQSKGYPKSMKASHNSVQGPKS